MPALADQHSTSWPGAAIAQSPMRSFQYIGQSLTLPLRVSVGFMGGSALKSMYFAALKFVGLSRALCFPSRLPVRITFSCFALPITVLLFQSTVSCSLSAVGAMEHRDCAIAVMRDVEVADLLVVRLTAPNASPPP